MDTKQALDVLSALGQPTRLNLLRWLLQRFPDAVAAGEIAEAFALSPATLSFHLNTLLRAALLDCRQESRHRYYSATPATMNALMHFLFEDCCGGNPLACPEGLVASLQPCDSAGGAEGQEWEVSE